MTEQLLRAERSVRRRGFRNVSWDGIQPFNNDYNLPGTLLKSEDIEINKTQILSFMALFIF